MRPTRAFSRSPREKAFFFGDGEVAFSGEKMGPGVPMARGSRRVRLPHALACFLFAAPIAANEAADPSPTELIEGLLSGRAPVGGPFELTDQTGHRRTDE